MGGGPAEARPASPAAGVTPIEVRSRPPKKVATRIVDYDVTSMKAPKQGPMIVRATCPKDAQIHKGHRGYLLDPKTDEPLRDGPVVVTRVKEGQIEGTTTLKRPVKATKLRLHVRR